MILHTDKAGNVLSRDSDGRMAVRNAEGKLVTTKEFNSFVAGREVKEALKRQGIELTPVSKSEMKTPSYKNWKEGMKKVPMSNELDVHKETAVWN